MPEEKKPLVDMNFLKGFAAGYFLNTVLNKHAMVGAVVGLLAGITSEQQHPEFWPNVSDNATQMWKQYKKNMGWRDEDS